jgi:hypothetical protein
MNEALAGIIAELEKRSAALTKAIMSLRDIDDDMESVRVASSIPESVTGSSATPVKRKGFKRTAAQRKRMAESQRLRFARQRGEA